MKRKMYKSLVLSAALSMVMLIGCSDRGDMAEEGSVVSASADKPGNTVTEGSVTRSTEQLVDEKDGPTADNPATLRISYNAPTSLNTAVVNWEQEHGMAAIFKNIVESGSNGAIKVELYPNSQLGDNKASMEMVMDGSLEACIETGVIPGVYPEFQVISIPYLFKSPEIAWYVFDESAYWQNLKEDFREKTGMRILAMGQNGVRHFTHKSKVFKTPEDLEGEKIRVMQSPIFVKMMEAFGANAVPMAWSELYTSLQTGVVSGQENPISVIVANNLEEVQPYITLDGHLWSEDGFLLNDAFYNSLPKVFQDLIMQAARQAEVTNRAIETIHSNGPGFQKLVEEGINIYVPSMKEKQAFADKAQPPVIAYLKDSLGDETVDGMLNAVKEAETVLGY